jgi:hypothetical protein
VFRRFMGNRRAAQAWDWRLLSALCGCMDEV